MQKYTSGRIAYLSRSQTAPGVGENDFIEDQKETGFNIEEPRIKNSGSLR